MLRDVLADLTMAERALAILEAAAPDPERTTHLAAVRAAIAQLATFIPPGAAA
jgi:hypothetical protein